MSFVASVVVAVGVFAALVYGAPAIFASSGGGIMLSVAIAYAAALWAFHKIAKRHNFVVSVLLLVVVIGTAYRYLVIVDRQPPPFLGASHGGMNQPRK